MLKLLLLLLSWCAFWGCISCRSWVLALVALVILWLCFGAWAFAECWKDHEAVSNKKGPLPEGGGGSGPLEAA